MATGSGFCPNCGSTDVPAQNSRHPSSLPARIQSRKCRQCGQNFKCVVKTKPKGMLA